MSKIIEAIVEFDNSAAKDLKIGQAVAATSGDSGVIVGLNQVVKDEE
jgi:hypothetical protein